MSETKRCYRLPPCSAYDVEGTEAWLSDMAEKGWQLSRDGFFCGVAAFEAAGKANTVYRLSADMENRGWLADDPDADPEMAELGQRYGWEYVTKRGEFFIWRTDHGNARELETDPQVQAMALKAVHRRQISATVSGVLWLLAYPLLKLRGGVFLTMVNLGSGFVLAGLLLVLWFLSVSVFRAVKLSLLRKKLLGKACGGAQQKQNAPLYYALGALRWILVGVWICVALGKFGNAVMEEDEMPITQFRQPPPFATLTEFAGGNVESYEPWANDYFNTVRVWSDWLSEDNYAWEENAKLRTTDGKHLDGLLIVEYHDAKATWIAERLAGEYVAFAKSERKYEPVGDLETGAEFCWAYYNRIHRPTVIVRCGKKVVRASFSAYTNEVELTLEDWARILSESIC